MGNVIVKFEKFLTLSFYPHQKNCSWLLAAIINFESIIEKSLANPHVARNVMLKFQQK